MEKLKNGFSLYFGLSLVFPFLLTILNIFFVLILGIDLKYSFLEFLKIIWIDYYFTGCIGTVMAYKIHLGFLFIILLFTFFSD